MENKMTQDLDKRLKHLEDAIRKNIKFAESGNLISLQGGKLAWLVDIRAVMLQPDSLCTIAEAFWVSHLNVEPFQLCGLELAGIPLMSAIMCHPAAAGRLTNSILVRKERKKTGLGNLIEGEINSSPIIMVDDIINSGDSFEKARVALDAIGREVTGAFVVLDYRSAKGIQWRDRNKIEIKTIFTPDKIGLNIIDRKPRPARDTFSLKWKFTQSQGNPFYVVPKSTPVLAENKLMFGSDSGTFWCLDPESGSVLWKHEVAGSGRKGIWSSPRYFNDRVMFGAYNGDLYCLDVHDGAVHWRSPLCEWIGSTPLILEDHNIAVIGLEYERPRQKGSMAAVALATGEKVWEYPLKSYQHGSGTHYKSADAVISGTNDHNIISIDCNSGRLNWLTKTNRSIKYAPTVDEERRIVCAASFDGGIYILNADSGTIIKVIQTNNICYTTPLISNGRLFCGSGDRNMYIIDLENFEIVEKIDCRARIYSSPTMVGNHVAFGTNGGVYQELDPVTLEIKSSIFLPDAITNSVISINEGHRIYIPTAMNEIYCFDREYL